MGDITPIPPPPLTAGTMMYLHTRILLDVGVGQTENGFSGATALLAHKSDGPSCWPSRLTWSRKKWQVCAAWIAAIKREKPREGRVEPPRASCCPHHCRRMKLAPLPGIRALMAVRGARTGLGASPFSAGLDCGLSWAMPGSGLLGLLAGVSALP